jgi:aspartate kinase
VAAATSNEVTKNEIVEEAKTTIREICADHVIAARASVQNLQLQREVCDSIQEDCQELIDYIIAAKRFNLEVNARSKDRVIGFGEKLSCRFMTAVLKDNVCVSCEHMTLLVLTPTFRMLTRNTLISQTSCTTIAQTG